MVGQAALNELEVAVSEYEIPLVSSHKKYQQQPHQQLEEDFYSQDKDQSRPK